MTFTELIADTEADEAMDDRTNDMMVEWFKLVMQRNELVREESALIYQSVYCIRRVGCEEL